MEAQTIYAIDGYIPSDEDIIVINIYKLIKYGRDKVLYAWVMINGVESNGIGTQTNEFGELDKIDAILQINGYLSENSIVGKFTFEEIIQKYQELKSALTEELNLKKK